MSLFNPDGSIKLPKELQENKDNTEQRMKNQRCLLVRKDLVYDRAPKKCVLSIKLSDNLNDPNFVEKTYKFFIEQSETPTKHIKINEKEHQIEIGSDFRRCSDCANLISRFKSFLYDNVIVEKGSCTFERKTQDFCYEDHFN